MVVGIPRDLTAEGVGFATGRSIGRYLKRNTGFLSRKRDILDPRRRRSID